MSGERIERLCHRISKSPFSRHVIHSIILKALTKPTVHCHASGALLETSPATVRSCPTHRQHLQLCWLGFYLSRFPGQLEQFECLTWYTSGEETEMGHVKYSKNMSRSGGLRGQGLMSLLAWSFLCCWGWPWTPDSSASVTGVLGLQMCAITPSEEK